MYTNREGIEVPGCWGKTAKGEPQVKRKEKEQWKQRLEVLHSKLQTFTKYGPVKEVEIVKLFYTHAD